MTKTKWRTTAIAIACIVAYYTDDGAGFAKNQLAPAGCEVQAGGVSSVLEREHACSLIRHTVPHRNS